MYFRLAVVTLSLVVLGGIALIVAGILQPLSADYATTYAGYEGPHLDRSSGFIGTNRGQDMFLCNWDGEVFWGRLLNDYPDDPFPRKVPPEQLDAFFDANNSLRDLTADGWRVYEAVLCSKALKGRPRLLGITQQRPFPHLGKPNALKEHRALIINADTAELLAVLDLGRIFSDLALRAAVVASVDCVSSGNDDKLVLNLYFSPSYQITSNVVGTWKHDTFELSPMQEFGLKDSAFILGPDDQLLWIDDEELATVFPAASSRTAKRIPDWGRCRISLRETLLAALNCCALLALVTTAALALLISGRARLT